MATKIVWTGVAPTKCQTCQSQIKGVFYDMRTVHGAWANMCPTCALLGPGIGETGTGFGQKYERKRGEWVKTEG